MSNAPPENEKPHEGPVDTLREGSLKATIWKNETERGVAFNATFSRVYQKAEGDWAETRSIPSKDFLRLSELGRAAHHRVSDLQRDYYETRDAFKDARSAKPRSPEKDRER